MDTGLLHDQFFHVRVIIGVVAGLAVGRLLTGLAQFVQNPDRNRIHLVHIGWVFFVLFAVVHFWWFEFGLSRLHQWTFPVYLFIIFYASLFFFIATILFPDARDKGTDFADYFEARRAWFFGLLCLLFLVDIVDTAIKGGEHFRSLGILYPARQLILAAMAVIAMFVGDRRYQTAFVIIALAAQIALILRRYLVLV